MNEPETIRKGEKNSRIAGARSGAINAVCEAPNHEKNHTFPDKWKIRAPNQLKNFVIAFFLVSFDSSVKNPGKKRIDKSGNEEFHHGKRKTIPRFASVLLVSFGEILEQ